MIRMLLSDMLEELGYTIAAEAGRLDEALEAAKTAEFDLAILDVNLNNEPVSPVADALVARGLPFVFATGYGEHGLPEPYRDRPALKKPFQWTASSACSGVHWKAGSRVQAGRTTARHGQPRSHLLPIDP